MTNIERMTGGRTTKLLLEKIFGEKEGIKLLTTLAIFLVPQKPF